MSKIRIDSSLCKKCGLCVEICPEGVFIQKRKDSVPRVAHVRDCISCGHCVDTCPVEAIKHEDFTE